MITVFTLHVMCVKAILPQAVKLESDCHTHSKKVCLSKYSCS